MIRILGPWRHVCRGMWSLSRSVHGVCRMLVLGMLNMLLVSRGTSLHLISLDVPYFTDVVLPLNYLQNAVAADLDPLTGH